MTGGEAQLFEEREASRAAAGLDRVWVWYLLTTTIAVVATGVQGEPWRYVAINVALLAGLAAVRALAERGSATRARALRVAFTLLAVPPVFFSMGLVLPAVHPEPWEYAWIDLDRAMFGADPTVAWQAWLTPWLTEILQWCYASFYLLPFAALVGAARHHGIDRFERETVVLLFCLFISYLGYFLFPTLPPYRFLEHPEPLEGVWLAEWLHHGLDAAELHRWDCFPSGHTMVTVAAMVVAWRSARSWFWPLLPIASGLVVSTVALRYHYVSDVIAGLLLVAPAMWLGRAVAADRPT